MWLAMLFFVTHAQDRRSEALTRTDWRTAFEEKSRELGIAGTLDYEMEGEAQITHAAIPRMFTSTIVTGAPASPLLKSRRSLKRVRTPITLDGQA